MIEPGEEARLRAPRPGRPRGVPGAFAGPVCLSQGRQPRLSDNAAIVHSVGVSGALRSCFCGLVALLAMAPSAGAWSLVQVGAHERSLEIIQDRGACESLNESVVQSSSFVRITITATSTLRPGSFCIDLLYIGRYAVPLSRPLAGRHIAGAERPSRGQGPYSPVKSGSSYPVVPRLVGLSPPDARYVLGGLGLHAVMRVASRVPGRPRVVSESPAAGARDPADRLVRVGVAR